MTISLGHPLPGASSDLPGSHNGPGRPRGLRFVSVNPQGAGTAPCLVLLLVGFTEPGRSPAPAGELLPHRFTLTATAFLRSARGGFFSVALSLPEKIERWALPTTMPHGVRTFLPGMSPTGCRQPAGLQGGHLVHQVPINDCRMSGGSMETRNCTKWLSGPILSSKSLVLVRERGEKPPHQHQVLIRHHTRHLVVNLATPVKLEQTNPIARPPGSGTASHAELARVFPQPVSRPRI